MLNFDKLDRNGFAKEGVYVTDEDAMRRQSWRRN